MLARIINSLKKRRARVRQFPILVKRLGAVFLLDPDNWIDNRLAAGVPYEEAQLAMAVSLVEQRGLGVVIDIGANFGLYTVVLGRVGKVHSVIAFEPVSRNYAQLMGNVFANRLWTKVESHRLALGAKPELTVINVNPRSTGVSRLDLATAGRELAVFTERESVVIARFDDVVGLSQSRCFVKIDVEGGAREVLSGMSRFLSNNEAVLQIELSEHENVPVKMDLAAMGFHEIAAIDRDFYFARRGHEDLG